MDHREYLARIGHKGGRIGGKSTSPAKRRAARRNAQKATAARWPKKIKP